MVSFNSLCSFISYCSFRTFNFLIIKCNFSVLYRDSTVKINWIITILSHIQIKFSTAQIGANYRNCPCITDVSKLCVITFLCKIILYIVISITIYTPQQQFLLGVNHSIIAITRSFHIRQTLIQIIIITAASIGLMRLSIYSSVFISCAIKAVLFYSNTSITRGSRCKRNYSIFAIGCNLICTGCCVCYELIKYTALRHRNIIVCCKQVRIFPIFSSI